MAWLREIGGNEVQKVRLEETRWHYLEGMSAYLSNPTNSLKRNKKDEFMANMFQVGGL